MSAALDGLIARLETASKGSQELDAAVISYLVGAEPLFVERVGRWCLYKGLGRQGQPRLWEPLGDFEEQLWRISGDLGPTRSVDATLILKPRDANCWGVEVSPSGCEAYASRNNVTSGHWLAEARHPTSPELALCAAFVRARIDGPPHEEPTDAG